MLSLEKRELREKYKAKRNNIDNDIRRQKEELINERLFEMPQLNGAELVLCYWSVNNEIDTHAIIRRLWNDGKSVALPLCQSEPGIMDFHLVKSTAELKQGSKGLMEPNPELCPRVCDFNNSVCIVPALVYDENGHRLGYGGGYYDRFLGNYYETTIGIAFSDFILKNLPHSRYDVPVNYLVTEKEILIC